MKVTKGNVLRSILICFITLCIPLLLIIDAIQSRNYADLKKNVQELERKQDALIEENKNLITDISQLASSDRIEDIAEEQLNMRQAESDEIVRVEMKKNNRDDTK